MKTVVEVRWPLSSGFVARWASETDAVSDLPFMGKDISKKCVPLPAALPTIT